MPCRVGNKTRVHRHVLLALSLSHGTALLLDSWANANLIQVSHQFVQRALQMLKEVHTCSLQLRTLIGELQTMHSVELEGQWFKRLCDMKFGKRLAKRALQSDGKTLSGPEFIMELKADLAAQLQLPETAHRSIDVSPDCCWLISPRALLHCTYFCPVSLRVSSHCPWPGLLCSG